MHPYRFARPVLAIAVVGLFLGGQALSLGAQEATPAADTAGVGGGAIAGGEPEAAPGHTLSLRRVVFEPGGYVSLHNHPGALALYVDSGALAYAVVEGQAEVQRAGAGGTPGPVERLGPGDEAVLAAGDWLFEQGIVHSARNDTDQPTVVLIAALTAADEPFTNFHEEPATPTP